MGGPDGTETAVPAPGVVMAGAEALHAPGAGGNTVGVLLLHGFTGSPSTLRGLGQAAGAAGYRVSLPLLPGHGTHWRDLDATGWAEWSAAADAALTELAGSVERVVVVGHSNGGALALSIAERRPSAVAGLVLVNPAVNLADRRLVFLPILRRARSSVAGVAGDVAKPGVRVVGYDRTPLAALASMVAAWKGVRAQLPAVRCPLLLLRSRVDHVVDASSARRILAGVSSTDREVVVLERSFHEAPVDHDADEIVERTLRFIARVGPTPGVAGPEQAG